MDAPSEVQECTEVSPSGRDEQVVRIPAGYCFNTDRVFIRRDEQTGNIVLSPAAPSPKPNWDEIFKALDEAGFPDDFMDDRQQCSCHLHSDGSDEHVRQ